MQQIYRRISMLKCDFPKRQRFLLIEIEMGNGLGVLKFSEVTVLF